LSFEAQRPVDRREAGEGGVRDVHRLDAAEVVDVVRGGVEEEGSGDGDERVAEAVVCPD